MHKQLKVVFCGLDLSANFMTVHYRINGKEHSITIPQFPKDYTGRLRNAVTEIRAARHR